MGFILWVDEEYAWAQGTYEYRAMGTAVIAASDLFHARDFSPRRRAPATRDRRMQGWFASLGAVNQHLLARRRTHHNKSSGDGLD